MGHWVDGQPCGSMLGPEMVSVSRNLPSFQVLGWPVIEIERSELIRDQVRWGSPVRLWSNRRGGKILDSCVGFQFEACTTYFRV